MPGVDWDCPHCGAPVTAVQRQVVDCRFCGAVLDLYHSLCPGCGFLNPEGERLCTQCGTDVIRTCPSCQEDNWAGIGRCVHCGQSLDLVDIIAESRLQDTQARLSAQRQEANVIKQQEKAGSEARMENFWEMERQRLGETARHTAEKRRRERVFLGAVLIAIAACILLLAGVSLAWTLLGS